MKIKNKCILVFTLVGSLISLASCNFNNIFPNNDNKDGNDDDSGSKEEEKADATINISSQYGYVTSSESKGKEGDLVTLTFSPYDNYELDYCTVNGVEISVSNNSYSFNLIKGNNNVVAVFKKMETAPTVDDFSGSLVYNEGAGNISTGSFTTENINLSSIATSGYCSYDYSYRTIRIGSSKKTGSITFNFDKEYRFGNIYLDCDCYNNDADVSLKITAGDVTKTIVLDGSSDPYTIELNSTTSSITLSSVATSKRIVFYGMSFGEAEEINVTGINASQESINGYVGRSIDLKDIFVISPSNATNKVYSLICNDSSVSINGTKIVASSAGSYEVKATTDDGGFVASVLLNIEEVPDGGTDYGYRTLGKDDIRFNYYDLNLSSEVYSVPPTGNSKILVVPVQFSDLSTKWTTERINSLNIALNGSNNDGSNSYWESLKSYFDKSSYGKLNLDITVSDVCTPSMTARTFLRETDDYGTETIDLIEDIYSKITINNVKLSSSYSDYDSNDDGYIDGICFIYNEFNMNNVDSNSYWAYTYSYYSSNDFYDDIPISVYSNMAAAFNYEQSTLGYDAHTLIHETGHLLGLDDYYSYDTDYGPLGSLDMMDMNIGDNNAFSKFSLGWIDTKIINETSGSVTLRPFESSGDCLIVPSSYFNDSAFGEYLIIEYYTPDGLNKLDSTTTYSTRSKLYTQSGILVYHVDARIAQYKYNSITNESSCTGNYLSTSATSIPVYDENTGYFYLISTSNTESRTYKSGEYLISLCGADNTKYYGRKEASNASLFKEGDSINKSSISAYLKSGKFNNGDSFTYNIKIESMDESGVTLTF